MTMQDFLKLVSYLAPSIQTLIICVVALIGISKFEKQIKELISRISKVSGGGLSLEAREKVAEIIQSGSELGKLAEKATNNQPELKPQLEKEKQIFIGSALGTMTYLGGAPLNLSQIKESSQGLTIADLQKRIDAFQASFKDVGYGSDKAKVEAQVSLRDEGHGTDSVKVKDVTST